MNCPKCGNENENEAKFCKHCGAKLESPKSKINTNERDKKVIIGLLIIIGILIAASAIFLTMNLTSDNGPEFETHDFGDFTMKVPKGTTFKEYSTVGKGTNYWATGYECDGSDDLYTVWVGNYDGASEYVYDYVGKDGDMTIYRGPFNTTSLMRHVDGYYIQLGGPGDVELMKEMARSINVKNPITSQSTSSSSSTTQSHPSSPSSISILGGSFSTGSAESDKTYARINVGTAHAGENVIVQIWYSRDGNTLNHGNMVPASVHSDGYLEIASADAYHYYPDHATINIYDTNSHLLTSKSVNLSPSSGTQTF